MLFVVPKSTANCFTAIPKRMKTICAMMTNDAIELKLTELKPELYIKYSVIRINLINTDPDQTGPANGLFISRWS
jgi:hypothetical protein